MRTRRQTELSEVIRAGMGIQARGRKKKKKKTEVEGFRLGGIKRNLIIHGWISRQRAYRSSPAS